MINPQSVWLNDYYQRRTNVVLQQENPVFIYNGKIDLSNGDIEKKMYFHKLSL